ncbi:MAG TPA: peptidoglycan editing factor PgeF [Tepidisphaeraceae bacterium]
MMQRRKSATGVVFYASTLLEGIGVRHAFSTRLGGVSEGVFASLNLGNPSGCEIQDAGETIEENYRRLLSAIGCAGMDRCRAHQVHGSRVLELRRDHTFENGQKADAIVSDDPTRVAAVRVADCVPVLLSTEDGAIVGAVHSGWRGVIAGVVPAAVLRMRELSGKPRSIIAAIGPSISFDAFEVGPEVLAEFERVFGPDAPVRRRDDGKGQVDLRQAIRLQLDQLNIRDEHIDITDRCTFRDADEFYSHRRDRGITGRMAAVIAAGSDPTQARS